MKATKIDWCDSTINPVVGCKNSCRYCYARKLNARFGFIPDWKQLQFFPQRLEQLNSKTPKSIFMDSMSDIDYWEDEWIFQITKIIDENRQHRYIFLTKGLNDDHGLRHFEVCFFGFWSSIYRNGGFRKIVFIGKTINFNNQKDYEHYDFLSIEPILEPIDLVLYPSIKQVIIGAETGNSKDKVIPKKEWIMDIASKCDKTNVRVFMKESLRKIMGADFRQDKLIWDVKE